jgi:hypothetical protein
MGLLALGPLYSERGSPRRLEYRLEPSLSRVARGTASVGLGLSIEVRGVPFRLPRRYSGVKLAEAFAIPDLDREVKWHCRYARQNGIHVSPTFMVDGLVQTDMSSGGPVADWVARLLDH